MTLKVGDRVTIVKPNGVITNYRFEWVDGMDKYNEAQTHVIKILGVPEDEQIQAYDLDIDGGNYGWLESFLEPIKG